jgi:hypothetical protein
MQFLEELDESTRKAFAVLCSCLGHAAKERFVPVPIEIEERSHMGKHTKDIVLVICVQGPRRGDSQVLNEIARVKALL